MERHSRPVRLDPALDVALDPAIDPAIDPAPTGGAPAPLEVRFARPADIPSLLDLESLQWSAEQAAGAADFAERIDRFPRLSAVALRAGTGRLVGSLFLQPITRAQIHLAATWADCARAHTEASPSADCLFGTSLTSVDPDAVDGLRDFLARHLAPGRWRTLYLGSPLPGLRAWRQQHPDSPAEAYVSERTVGLPRDPLLRYYFARGLRRVEAVKPGYFPHPASLDHGAVISGSVQVVFSPAAAGRSVPAHGERRAG